MKFLTLSIVVLAICLSLTQSAPTTDGPVVDKSTFGTVKSFNDATSHGSLVEDSSNKVFNFGSDDNPPTLFKPGQRVSLVLKTQTLKDKTFQWVVNVRPL